LVSELIKGWLAACFHKAQQTPTTTKFYFKEMHDQLEIFELNTCQKWYEQAEFELFVKNNQANQMHLL